jgi:hypothetical protein
MSSLSLRESIHLQRLLQKDKISEQHYIPGVPGKFRFRLGPGGWPLETVVVVVAGVAGWDVGGSAVLLPSPDDKLASPADALVMLDNVISSSSSGPPSFLPPQPSQLLATAAATTTYYYSSPSATFVPPPRN